MMDTLKKIFNSNFNFSGKMRRDEFKIYFIIDTLLEVLCLVLYAKVNIENSDILNIFYTCIILLLKFIPFQSATTKRLRDAGINPGFVLFNFIPIVNLIFRCFLCVTKQKEDLNLTLREIGNN